MVNITRHVIEREGDPLPEIAFRTDEFTVPENDFVWVIEATRHGDDSKHSPFITEMYGRIPGQKQVARVSDRDLFGYNTPAFSELEAKRRILLLIDEAHMYGK